MGIFYQTESFLTACISLLHEPDKSWSRQYPSCTNSRKELTRNCSPIGHNNTKHFLCPIRSRYPLEFLEIVRWESVPRGSFARTWKLSSRLFSRPDWLPLGLWECVDERNVVKPSLPSPHAAFRAYFWIRFPHYLGAWNRLMCYLTVGNQF